MSDGFHIPYTRVIVSVFGITLLLIGGALTYFSITTDGAAASRSFTPLGFLVAILGIFLLISKDA
jgi:hypothetical protein